MLWWGENQTLRLGRRVWFLVFWGAIGGMAGKALPNGGGAAMGRAVWCGFAMLESCGKGGFAADEVLRGWSEGDGAVGGLGLRQKGLAAL